MAKRFATLKTFKSRHPFRRRRPRLSLFAALLLTVALYFGCTPADFQAAINDRFSPDQSTKSSRAQLSTQQTGTSATSATSAVPSTKPEVTSQLTVHFLDVGQADCILAIQGDVSMLIDAGNNDDADYIINYLKMQGLSDLDYIIATHPHEDHIGSLDDIVSTFEIGKVLMPDLATGYKTYTDLMSAIKKKNLTVIHPNFGQVYTLGDATFQILSQPAMKYFSTNAASIILKLKLGQNAFLLTGDAEVTEEEQLLATGYDITSDVLKIGHHGSDSSTSVAFLEAVNPSAAVIQVSSDNPYGYPDLEVLNDLMAGHIEIYRTDLAGDIVATTDGQTITFDKLPKTGTHGTKIN